MIADKIREQIASLPETECWPELAAIFDRTGQAVRPDWELPLLACRAVGGAEIDALPAAAAIACLQVSIILVDDILDSDPRGTHHELGYGPTANMAVGYQSAAIRLLAIADLPSDRRIAAIDCITRAALATAAGQQLDVQNLASESSYWEVVKAKSTPFYGGALRLGAILGGASYRQAEALYDLGVVIGEIIQIEDDLQDALAVPANSDWTQGRNNLLILYASSAKHPDRERFIELIPLIDDLTSLNESQRILVRCGAVSYAAYQLVTRYRLARQLLDRADLANSKPLQNILEAYADTLVSLLSVSGVEITKRQLLEALVWQAPDKA